MDYLHQNKSRTVQRVAAVLMMAGALLVGPVPAYGVVSQMPASTPVFNGTVWATAYAGNTIYVGGDFTEAIVGGRHVPRAHLAAINATTGDLLRWAPRADDRVRAIAVSGGSVYVAGQFSTIDGAWRDSLAEIDAHSGLLHDSFQHTVVGTPYALAIGSGRLYAGGSISQVNGHRRTRLAAFRLAGGGLDMVWRPTADAQVQALVATPGRVYIGGKFHRVNDSPDTLRLAAVSPTTGRLVGSFRPKAQYITYGIAVTRSRVYATHGGRGGRLVSYELTGRRRWMLTTDGDARAVAVLGGIVYVGGHFDNVCRSPRTGGQGSCLDGETSRGKLAAVGQEGRLLPWSPHGNGVRGVLTLAANGPLGKLAAGGAFTTVNGVPHKRFAQFS